MRFEPLRERLLKAGIAPKHVRRYLRELGDHLEDLTVAHGGDGARALAQLGDEDQLAAAMLARPQLKSWAARAPWLVFGLAPPLAILALFFAAALPLVVIAKLHGMVGPNTITAPGWFRVLAQGTALAANLLLGPGLAALLAGTARRQRLNGKWPLLTVTLIALLGMHLTAWLPPSGQGGQISIGTVPFWRLFSLARFMAHLHGKAAQLSVVIGAPEWSWPFVMGQMLLTLAPLLWLWWTQTSARQTETKI